MKRTKLIGLAWILLACGISIWGGSSLGRKADRWVDFKAVYYGTRCLLEHHNPYNISELDGFYRSQTGERPSESIRDHLGVTLYVNLPTTFIFVAPFALLPWGLAHVLWMTLTAGVFILAALLIWNLGANYAPNVSLFLICILLVDCESIFVAGNTAGIVVSLGVVAVWCFLEERFVPVGILCLVVSLAIKPHDAGLVWLYFLLAGGVYRKRALQTLFIALVLGLLACLWVWHIAPHWMGDWQTNLASISAHGGLNDPGPDSLTGRSGAMVIDLQSALILLRQDPRFYNLVSYLVCGVPLLIWSVRTITSRFTPARAWLALASVVPLTMVVTYHRPWDAKLLLLTVPACAILWAEGGAIRWIALLLSAAGIVMTGDIPLTILTILTRNIGISTGGLPGKLLTVVELRPVPLILLAMGIFYLWMYLRRDPGRDAGAEHGEGVEAAPSPSAA
jgi:hypothetical protein